MRDRLIETKQSILKLIKEAEEQFSGTGKALLDIEDYVAEYLTANGVIVPPCKVGDRMYCDGELFADHCKGEIMSFPVDIILTEVCSTHRGEIDMVFDFKRFGKDVFLTREEAEAKLKEGKG